MKLKWPHLFIILFLLCTIFYSQGYAQYYFGRNKIQYNQFDWHILKTEHFDIYYYPEMRELAEIGAAHAENVYTLLETKFNHNIAQKIPLIFYATHAHFQETNTTPYMVQEGVGGFFEFLKGRVVVPANGSIPDFKHVIQHELVHVFTMSKYNRIIKDHRQLNHPGMPLWFIEGLAEYWSTGWDSQAEMFIRDAILNDYLFPIQNLYQISGSFLMYKEGQAIVKYIAENYGDEKILQLIENVWMTRQFSNVMKITLGKNFVEFNKEWEYALKKQKYPLLEDNDSASMISTPITNKGINIKPAFYKQDQDSFIVYISNRTGYSNIYIQPLVPVESKVKAKVLVAGERTPEFESFHLLSSNISVNKDKELTFISKSGEKDNLYILDIETDKITTKKYFKDLVSIYSPAWSPDNQKIVFTGIGFTGKSDLYIYERETQELVRLTDDHFDDVDANWSPDNRYIIFSSDRGYHGKQGAYNLFTYDLKTGLVNYITTGPHHDRAPKWSPDGQYLAFTSDRSGTSNIWILQTKNASKSFLDTNSKTPNFLEQNKWLTDLNREYQLKQVTFFTTGAFDPEWTDSENLLYTAFEKHSFQIHLYKNPIQKFMQQPLVVKREITPEFSTWAFNRLGGESGSAGIKYKTKYNLDIAQSQITQDPIFGTSGGMQLAISDMLGNYQYFFLLYNTARTRDEFLESFNFAVSRVDLSRRTNTAIGFYHFAGRFYNLYDSWFWERRFGGFGAISYPISKFKRVEASLNVRSSDKEWYSSQYRRKALLVSNFASYIKDTSLWGPTGPIDGERINFTIGNTIDVAHSNVNFVTTILDYRRYFRLNTSVSHAMRFWTQINNGKESTPFFMGGSWDLRGYSFWRIWGTKMAFMSQELRFPFINRFMVHFPFGGLAFSSIRGALFVDAGNAWDNDLDRILGSTGFGVRFQFAGVLVLRFDVGRKFNLFLDEEHPYKIMKYDMNHRWFTQFFFGWDF